MVNFYSDKADGTSMDWAFAEAGISLAYTVEMRPTRFVMLLLTCGTQVLKRCLKPALPQPPPKKNINYLEISCLTMHERYIKHIFSFYKTA